MPHLCRNSIIVGVLFFPIIVVGQSGPGGVSNDSDPVENCRLWLDAGDLASPTQTDGTEVIWWIDKSQSAVEDTALWDVSFNEMFTPPLFRSDPAYSINGKPVVSFEDGGMLLMGLAANAGLNPDLVADGNAGATAQRTVFIAFRTGNDIASRQFLWEQGGGWKGLGIYIYNSNVYISAYDIKGGSWPKFGFIYKKATIQPNTTYVVSLILDAPTTNTLDTDIANNTSFRGTINGGNFGILEQGPSNSNIPGGGFGVGRIGHQGDPIGVGGVNSLTADESTFYDWTTAGDPGLGFLPCDNSLEKPLGLTGQYTFKGRIAEICYYAYSLNDAERIIVENYLSAKYFANVIDNDKFIYQANFGSDVIGIGAEANGDPHNHSKGDNLFEISVSDMEAAFKYEPGAHYLLVGRNENPIQWINQNTPDTANILRLRRTWRFDRTGFDGIEGDQQVTIKLDTADLPPLPSPDHKLAVLIDQSNGPLPNFSASPKLIEIPLTGSICEGTYLIPDGAYFTIAAVKPTLQFKKNTDFTLESDNVTPTIASVEVELNYAPLQASPIVTGVIFIPGTASTPADYTTSGTSVSITPPNRTGSVSFNIINDNVVDVPPVKDFLIILDPTATDAGYFIGQKDTLIYKIYDDDPDPKATFASATNDTTTEAGIGGIGNAQITVRINGTTSSFDNRTLRIIDDLTGTAEYGVDYTLPTADGWQDLSAPEIGRYKDIVVPYGTNMTSALQFPVFADNIDENDESIHFRLEPQGDIATDVNSIVNHTINLIDINAEPEVDFLSTNSEGFEAVSQPRIVVILSGVSAKTIVVPFSITGGNATNGANQSNSDYSAEVSGTVIFSPGDTLSYLYYDPNTGNVNLQVYSDAVQEDGETIDFELQNPVVNGQLGSGYTHTYTIKDYTAFEWTGAAGVGKARDNIFWVKLDNATTGQNGYVPQLSPRPVSIIQTVEGRQPTVVVGVNNRKVMDFNGTSHFYTVSGTHSGESPFVNTAGFYDSKDIFFVVTLTENGSSSARVIFEEGGQNNGLNVYLKNNRIYFQAWNTTDNDGSTGNLAPWGGNDSYAKSQILTTGSTYVVSCHYNREATTPLRIYVDGALQGSYGSTNTSASEYIGRLYVHEAKAAIGATFDDTRFDTGPPTYSPWGNFFNGQIGEMIYFTDRGEDMNTARIRILHNYLSARFNVALVPAAQVFDLTYADQTNTNPGYVVYNNDVAGIGIIDVGNVHGVAKGPAEMKVSDSSLSGTNHFIVWGHNGESFTNTWPHSYWNADLPAGVRERSGRVWRFSKNFAAAAQLKIEMDFSESANAPYLTAHRTLLKLLVSSDPNDWGGATVYNPSATQPDQSEGARVVFDNVNISDGDYVALGNNSPINIAPLPVELLYFDAEFEGSYVNIHWATASEVNCDYFSIQRAASDLKWSEIARADGAGNSNRKNYYTEKDRNALSGISYYRLKQVDYDGDFKYSDVVSVINSNLPGSNEVFIYPNPVRGSSVILNIPYAYSKAESEVTIFALSGKVLLTTKLEIDQKTTLLNIDRLDPGAYLIQIQSSLLNETKKLIVE